MCKQSTYKLHLSKGIHMIRKLTMLFHIQIFIRYIYSTRFCLLGTLQTLHIHSFAKYIEHWYFIFNADNIAQNNLSFFIFLSSIFIKFRKSKQQKLLAKMLVRKIFNDDSLILSEDMQQRFNIPHNNFEFCTVSQPNFM